MNNMDLMKKVIELDTQTLHTREQSLKNSETNAKVLDFERERVLIVS